MEVKERLLEQFRIDLAGMTRTLSQTGSFFTLHTLCEFYDLAKDDNGS